MERQNGSDGNHIYVNMTNIFPRVITAITFEFTFVRSILLTLQWKYLPVAPLARPLNSSAVNQVNNINVYRTDQQTYLASIHTWLTCSNLTGYN